MAICIDYAEQYRTFESNCANGIRYFVTFRRFAKSLTKHIVISYQRVFSVYLSVSVYVYAHLFDDSKSEVAESMLMKLVMIVFTAYYRPTRIGLIWINRFHMQLLIRRGAKKFLNSIIAFVQTKDKLSMKVLGRKHVLPLVFFLFEQLNNCSLYEMEFETAHIA